MSLWVLLVSGFSVGLGQRCQQRAGQSDVSVLRQRHAHAEDAERRHVKVRLRCEFICHLMGFFPPGRVLVLVGPIFLLTVCSAETHQKIQIYGNIDVIVCHCEVKMKKKCFCKFLHILTGERETFKLKFKTHLSLQIY